MSIEELLTLAKEITKEINFKRQQLDKIESVLNQTEEEYVFEFEANYARARKVDFPYVAKLYVKNQKIERKFFDFEKAYLGDERTVFGKYKAKNYDIIDITHELYIVLCGELKKIELKTSASKALVYKFVKKEVELEELMTLVKQESKFFGVLDELKE